MPTSINLSPPISTNPIIHESINPLSDESAFARLAQLTPPEYDRIRKSEAKRMRIRIETLDSEVARYRSSAFFIPHPPVVAPTPGESGLHASDLKRSTLSTLPSVLPWPDPVDGGEVLSQVSDRFTLFIALPPGAADA